MLGFAMTGGGVVFFAIEKVVVVGEFLARMNVANGDNPYLSVDLIGLAVGITGMIDECGNTVSIDDAITISHGEKISDVAMFVDFVAFFFGNARPRIFDDLCAPLDRSSSKDAGSVNFRGSNDQSHVREVLLYECPPMRLSDAGESKNP